MTLIIGHDSKLAGAVRLNFQPGGMPEFQFPPICVQDNKKSNWLEKDVWAQAQLSINKGADARELGIEATYVIDGDWDAQRIIDQIRIIKSNIYMGEQKTPRYVMVTFYKISEAGGTYRMTDVTVKYSGPIIGNGAESLNMVSVVTMTMKFFDKLGEKQEVKGIVSTAKPEWY